MLPLAPPPPPPPPLFIYSFSPAFLYTELNMSTHHTEEGTEQWEHPEQQEAAGEYEYSEYDEASGVEHYNDQGGSEYCNNGYAEQTVDHEASGADWYAEDFNAEVIPSPVPSEKETPPVQVEANANAEHVGAPETGAPKQTSGIARSDSSHHLKFESHLKKYTVICLINAIVGTLLLVGALFFITTEKTVCFQYSYFTGNCLLEGTVEYPGLKIVKDSMIGTSQPLLLHSVLSAIIIIYKKAHGNKKALEKSMRDLEMGEGAFRDEEGKKTVFFSAKPKLIEKIILLTLGILVRFVSEILALIALSGLDLALFWFPEPFLDYLSDNLTFRSARIENHRIEFYSDFMDYYMQWLHVKTLDFFTWKFYSRCCAKKAYRQWKDKHIRFKGVPPEGYENEFSWFRARPPCCYKLTAQICSLMCKFSP